MRKCVKMANHPAVPSEPAQSSKRFTFFKPCAFKIHKNRRSANLPDHCTLFGAKGLSPIGPYRISQPRNYIHFICSDDKVKLGKPSSLYGGKFSEGLKPKALIFAQGAGIGRKSCFAPEESALLTPPLSPPLGTSPHSLIHSGLGCCPTYSRTPQLLCDKVRVLSE